MNPCLTVLPDGYYCFINNYNEQQAGKGMYKALATINNVMDEKLLRILDCCSKKIMWLMKGIYLIGFYILFVNLPLFSYNIFFLSFDR